MGLPPPHPHLHLDAAGGGCGGWLRTNTIGLNEAVQMNNSATRLGKGRFGEVYVASFRGQRAAAKSTRNPAGLPPLEIPLTCLCQGSPHVVELLGVEHETPWGTILVMRLYEGHCPDPAKSRRMQTNHSPSSRRRLSGSEAITGWHVGGPAPTVSARSLEPGWVG